MSEISVHSKLFALKMIIAFLLAREMAREDSSFEDLHEALIHDFIDVLEETVPDEAAQMRGELEAAISKEADWLFQMASNIARRMRR